MATTNLPAVGVRFQAEGQQQVGAAFRGMASQAQSTGATISRTFVDGQGKVTAFGRGSVTALNATGFAFSSLASTGKASFQTLATGAAGFASFFGAGGLIASGVISLGLILGDFWSKQRREIEETSRKATDELVAGAAARDLARDPVGAAQQRLDEERAKIDANRKAMADLFDPAKRTVQLKEGTFVRPVDEAALAKLTAERGRLLTAEMEALGRLNDARKKTTTTTKATEKATHDAARAADEADKALDQQVTALIELGKANLLTTKDLATVIRLEREYAAAARDSARAATERAEAARKASGLAGTAAGAIPTPAIRDIIDKNLGPTAPGPAKQLPNVVLPPVKKGGGDDWSKAFGDAFSQSLQNGLTGGFTQFLTSGSIEGLWNSVGGALVAGMSTLGPWWGAVGGIFASALGGLFGGGGRSGAQRPRPLPVDIRRVITDPNGRAPRFNQAGPAINVIGANTPRGQRILGTANRNFNRRGGGR
jgi:hypothetical protein